MLRIFCPLVVAALLLGCGKSGPAQLTLEQVPEALKTAFANAKPTFLKTSATSIAKLVEEKHYAAASVQLHALAGNTDLTDDQRDVVGGATIAVNAALQELAAAAAPEAGASPAATPHAPPVTPSQNEAAAAAAALEHHIRTK